MRVYNPYAVWDYLIQLFVKASFMRFVKVVIRESKPRGPSNVHATLPTTHHHQL